MTSAAPLLAAERLTLRAPVGGGVLVGAHARDGPRARRRLLVMGGCTSGNG